MFTPGYMLTSVRLMLYRGVIRSSTVDISDVSHNFDEALWGSNICALSLSLTLYSKRRRDEVIMLQFSVRREPFAVMGLPNVFLLQWGLYAVEPQWTELLVRKKRMLLLNYLQHESFILWKSCCLYLTDSSGWSCLRVQP